MTGYIPSILTDVEKEHMFYLLRDSVNWQKMSHKGGEVTRLISIQSSVVNVDGKRMMPLYRHPVDSHPEQVEFTQDVRYLKDKTEDVLCLPRDFFNHCLVQLYPEGTSHISDHSDKTLDIKRGTYIVNMSLGAVRHMKIKNKIKNESGTRDSVKIKMENGSVFILGWETNKMFYHGINPDNRDEKIKEEDELAFGTARISLTFRNIATFIDSDGKISGQGARKDLTSEIDEATEALNMLKAFSKENCEHNFDWDENYGCGFNSIGFSVINKT